MAECAIHASTLRNIQETAMVATLVFNNMVCPRVTQQRSSERGSCVLVTYKVDCVIAFYPSNDSLQLAHRLGAAVRA